MKSYIKLMSAVRIFVAILFLISPIGILSQKIPKYTLQNHEQRKLEVNENYIIVQYGKETTYKAKEFKNEIRQSIDYIRYQGEIVDLEKEFTIEANTVIEIYFSEPISSLDGFFSTNIQYNGDPKAKNIKLIDLSHFDSSSVKSTNNMFNGCSSLEEIYFDNFDTSKVTIMSYMFTGCSNLKSLNLSNFDTSQVQLMADMFRSCKSLEYLDISNFNTSRVMASSEMFEDANFLKYINLYYAQIDNIKHRIKGIIQNSTIVCQKDDFEIDDSNMTYIKSCCDYNLETSSCVPYNIIKVKYKKEVTYPYGFSIIEHDKSKNQYRKDIYRIEKKNRRYKPNEALTIEKNEEIKILFNSTIKSLTKFFYVYYDPNVEYISSIDFTHFDSSSIESLESTFYGCISLESINLSTFTTHSLTNMAQTFFNCTSLKTLDLSKLTSSSITNTEGIFYGCESLIYINMNNLDLSKVKNATYMFYNMKEIKYLDIQDTKFNDKINDEFKRENDFNDKDDLMICKNKENSGVGKYVSICCDYNIELKKCNNYMICNYKEATEYIYGFQNDYRENIAYIKNEDSIIGPNEKLIIKANTNIEIYFSEPTTTLSYFFSTLSDPNSKNIKLIDLSYFDSSSVKKTNYMFYGCSSLEEINFKNFNTSNVTDMSYMFSACSNLKFLNLSNFYTSNVKEISNMLDGCNSLEYLDISNFNTSNFDRFQNLFADVKSLKYINLYNATINDDIKYQIEEIAKDTTIVCQKNQIITKGLNSCSIFTPSDNYIIVEYGIETTYEVNEFTTLYSSPWLQYKYRQNIVYIKKGNSIIGPNEKLIFEANTNIEIHFSEPVKYLSMFFAEPKSKFIKRVDLSHFDSSLLEEITTMFDSCNHLEEINFDNFDTSKVTQLRYMFNQCSSLKSLDLSNFDTSQILEFDFLFCGCSSLKYLDISNFNTFKSSDYLSDTIFRSVGYLDYINLYNAQLSNFMIKEIEKVVNDKTIVCQKDKIINKGINDCSIFNKSGNYVRVENGSNDDEFIEFESNNLSNNTTQIIPTTFPENKNEETNVVLLGFSRFRTFNEGYFTFYIYLTATKNILTTKHIQFPIEITYYRNIRRLLKETNANCSLDLVGSDTKYKYNCRVDEEPDNIKEAKLIPDFDFVSQDNVTLTGTTPLAKMFMNNMMEMKNQDKYDNILENSRIYILDNSNFYKYEQLLFNITGEINDPQPKLDNKNLLLMINLENNDTTDIQIPCNISNITKNKYILHCKSNESFKGEIQSAISFIDNNDILLLNFADIKESNINIEATPNNRKFFMTKGKKLGAGAIVGIIISIIVVIALIVFIIIYLRKKNEKDVNDTNSSIKEFKISDVIKH